MINALNGVKQGLSNLADKGVATLSDKMDKLKAGLQAFGSPVVRDMARLLPEITKLNITIVAVTAAITTVVAVIKAMNEETRKFREISQRLAVINTTRNQGSQAELRQSTDLFAGLRRNSQILAELQIMGLTELNKNLINTAARLQLTGQSTEGFKKLTTTLLKFSSTTEGSLNRLSGDLIRISLQNGIKLDDLIDATMMTADSTRLAEFVGGAGGAQALAELKAQFAGLGGQLLGGQIAGFVDALADTPLGTLRTLGIEGSRDRLMRETDPSVQREIITQEIIPRLVRTFNVQAGDESTRTSNRFAVVQSLFGNLVGPTQDLINAFEKLGFITDDQTVNTSKLNSELERVATNTNAVADSMALNIERLTEKFDEAFAIRASDREEEVTEFDIAILSLTSSFRTLGTVLAPVGDFFVNMLAEISFALAKFNLYVARLLTFDDDVEDAITKQIDLIDKLDTLTDNDTLDQQQLMQAFDEIMAADPETEEGRRVIERNAQALGSLEQNTISTSNSSQYRRNNSKKFILRCTNSFQFSGQS